MKSSQRLGGNEASEVFVVIDYVESDRDVLVSLLKEWGQINRGRVRFMLLSRGIGEWWEELKREGDGVGDLLSGPATDKPIRVESLALSQEERQDSYQQAVAAFAQVMAVPVPETKRIDFDAPHYERILLLHMSALLDVADEPDSIGEQQEDERNQIVGRVLDREIRFWERLLLSRELDASLRKGLDGAMAAFTLIDGV